MKKKFNVQFSVSYNIQVECEPEDLKDEIANWNIPEEHDTEYVEDSFDVDSIEDEDGKKVDF